MKYAIIVDLTDQELADVQQLLHKHDLLIGAVTQPAKAPEPQAPAEPVQTAPAEVPPTPEMAIELPMPAAEEVEAPAEEVAAEEVAPAPQQLGSATIVNLDSAHSVPASFDATRPASVLKVAGAVTESVEQRTFSFTFGTTVFSVPHRDAPAAMRSTAAPTIAESVPDNAFRALVRLSTNAKIHGINLNVETVTEGETEQIIFGSDAAALITSHGEPSDAGIS